MSKDRSRKIQRFHSKSSRGPEAWLLSRLSFTKTRLNRWMRSWPSADLLSDAEIAEYVIKDVLGVNDSGDGAEMMQGLPNVACD